ncbi:MAG: TonB-dependent receptor [Bacteroidetes bacterium]|nr:TonB-dependent receptor [Bacteroidota bacterium]
MIKLNSLVILFAALSVVAYGQEEKDTTDEYTKLVDLGYIPGLKNSSKLNIPVRKYPINVADPEFTYAITPQLYKLNTYFREPMQPISLGKVQLPDLNPYYLQAGVGPRRNALLDFYVGSKRNATNQFSLRAFHQSGTNRIDASGVGHSLVDFNYKKVYSNTVLKTGLNFDQRRAHLYGYNFDTLFTDQADSLRRDFFNYGGFVSLSNAKNTKSSHQLNGKLSGYYFHNLDGTYEWDANFDGSVVEHLKNKSDLVFRAMYDYSAYGDSTQKLNRNLVFVDAAYVGKLKELKYKIGFKTATDNGDSVIKDNPAASDYTNFHFYPDIEAQYKLVGNYLIGYGGITGQMQKNSFKSQVWNNPFVAFNQRLENTNNALNLFVGAKGSVISDYIQFNARVSYNTFDNLMLFANSDSLENEFKAVYTGSNSSHTQIKAEVQYKEHERWMVNFAGSYNTFNFFTYLPLHMPTWEGNLAARYNFQNKITFKANVDAFSGRTVTNVSQTDTTVLKGVVDLSLGADYYLKKNLAVYGSVNNLFNQRYQVWNRYPVQGLHAWVGIRYNF